MGTIKARYSKHYAINAGELEWLGVRVEALGRIAGEVCAERIAVLEDAARAAD